MTIEERARDLRLLGLDDGVGEVEVLTAYHRRRALYETENLATYNLLKKEERQKLLSDLEAARDRLMGPSQPPKAAPKPTPSDSRHLNPPAGPEPDRDSSPGAYLQYHRLARGVGLNEVASETKIPQSRLEAVELETWSDLPAVVYVRGFVVTFARQLGLADPEELAQSFLKKMQSRAGGGNQG